MALAYVLVMLARPLPAAKATSDSIAASNVSPVAIAWPDYGQAAVGAVGFGVLETHGDQKPLPTASVAKVMTALAVLKQKPLKIGEQGPSITITEEDVLEYNRTVAQDGSNVPVVVGEEISEYEALQALMLPSANNMAYTLVRWAYGSEENYLKFVNNFAKSLGMQNSNFADASGFSEDTVSTAQDLAKLAVNAMDNPVLAEIASQKSANIPVAGQIYNVNMLLGRGGIVGVKTGNTEQAGGCFMSAAIKEVNGKKITVVTVIMGAPNLYTALQDSLPLVKTVSDGFSEVTFVKAGQEVGKYSLPWSPAIPLAVKDDLKGVTWSNGSINPGLNIESSNNIKTAGTKVGTIRAVVGREVVQSDVVLTKNVTEPSLLWRLKPRF